jgi:hypothetical protein
MSRHSLGSTLEGTRLGSGNRELVETIRASHSGKRHVPAEIAAFVGDTTKFLIS